MRITRQSKTVINAAVLELASRDDYTVTINATGLDQKLDQQTYTLMFTRSEVLSLFKCLDN